jgi:nitrogen regulatory protein P-II 1
MTKIEAIIGTSQLEEVLRALTHAWIAGLTVSEVKSCGGGAPHAEVGRGSELLVDVVPQLMVEVVLPDPLAPRILFELERAARAGSAHGRIVVTRIEHAVRVRTGEHGEAAL